MRRARRALRPTQGHGARRSRQQACEATFHPSSLAGVGSSHKDAPQRAWRVGREQAQAGCTSIDAQRGLQCSSQGAALQRSEQAHPRPAAAAGRRPATAAQRRRRRCGAGAGARTAARRRRPAGSGCPSRLQDAGVPVCRPWINWKVSVPSEPRGTPACQLSPGSRQRPRRAAPQPARQASQAARRPGRPAPALTGDGQEAPGVLHPHGGRLVLVLNVADGLRACGCGWAEVQRESE